MPLPLVASEVKEMETYYVPYVACREHASHAYGVYALLDEFHAYYKGSMAAYGYFT